MVRLVLAIVLAVLVSRAAADDVTMVYPLIQGFGGVVALPDAAEAPRKDAKVVFDITTESQPEDVNRGLESVARYLNLNAQAGLRPADIKLSLVLHGGATKCALSDAAYTQATQAPRNPNLALLRELKKYGVELFVCGQSLARNKYPASHVASELQVAVSAMTVNVNRQLDGYSYLALH